MKKIIILTLILHLSVQIRAQESTLKNGVGLGFQLNQYQNDFGFGLNFTSPLLFNQSMGFRLKGNMMFLQHIKDTITTWTSYSNVSLGLIGIGGKVGPNIRLYGEGGLIILFPSSNFSSESMPLGGYGLFGFEFFMSNNFNYFIEIGGVGIGAVADKVPNKPIYSNGLSIGSGFRIVL